MLKVVFEGLNTGYASLEEVEFTEEGFSSVEEAVDWVLNDAAGIIADDQEPDYFGRYTPEFDVKIEGFLNSLYVETYLHRGTYTILDEDGNDVDVDMAVFEKFVAA